MLISNHLSSNVFILSILEARTEILTKNVHFLGDLKTPKFPSEINRPLPENSTTEKTPKYLGGHAHTPVTHSFSSFQSHHMSKGLAD